MADKEKRFRKILSKKGWKGRLKLVATLEEADIILVNNRYTINLIGKGTYLEMIEKGYTAPEEEVYYVVSTNPRNTWNIEHKMLSNAFCCCKNPPK